jgi:CheY-like chemotaxis protein
LEPLEGSLRILLIDDNHDHAKILQWAFKNTGRRDEFTYFDDGTSALQYLKTASTGTSAKPDLIFLDLNLPRLDGREVLRLLKAEDETKAIPVIIVSSSEREEDVRRAYELGASSYVSKSSLLNDVKPVLQVLQAYQGSGAKSPNRKLP